MLDDFFKTLTNEQKAALITELSKGLPEGDVAESPPKRKRAKRKKVTQVVKQKTPVKKINDDFTVNKDISDKDRVRTVVKASKNLWKDDETEALDVETPSIEKTKRRPAAKILEVQCSACGKMQKVSEKVVYGKYHRCSRCVGSR